MKYVIPQLSKPLDLHPDYQTFKDKVLTVPEMGRYHCACAAISISKCCLSIQQNFKYPPSYILIAHPKNVLNIENDMAALRQYHNNATSQLNIPLFKIYNRYCFIVADPTIPEDTAYMCYNSSWIGTKTKILTTPNDTVEFEMEIDFSKPLIYDGHIKLTHIIGC